MDVRKLVSFGNSSFVISLPKSWVLKNGLKKGDVVRLEEKPHEITITARDEGKKSLKEAAISSEDRPLKEVKTEILAAYVNNCGIMKITGNNIKDISPALKQVIHGLVGMEVVEETASRILVKDLLDVSEVSMDNTVRRMDMLLKSMLEDSTHTDNVESVAERDKEVNRLALLSLRIFKAATDNPGMLKTFNTNYWDMFISRQVTVQLEHIGDYVKRIARLFTEADNAKTKELQRIYMQLAERYRDAMKIYYSNDRQQSYRMETDTKRFMQLCDKVLENNRDTATARIVENLKHMTKAVMYVLRAVMERDYPKEA